MKEYYSQRATTPGTLLITEATFIAPQAGGQKNVPGIYSEEQLDTWKEVVKGVHDKGSHIFCQLWAMGRQANEEHLKSENPYFTVVGPSAIPKQKGAPVPRELTVPEIKQYIRLYASAARKVVHEAHFDGVEVHGANGYLIDEFLQDVSDKRQDDYGGSVERRSRFGLEVMRAVVDAVGTAEKVGIRLSPWSPFGGMGMEDPVPQFSHFVSVLKREFPNLAYIHVIEPSVSGDQSHDAGTYTANDFLRELWWPQPYISAGGYEREDAIRRAEERENELVAFGRNFLANPDLPVRLKKNIPLTPYNRDAFYLEGDTSGKGYTDYPFADVADTT